VEVCLIYLMYFISKIVTQVTEYKVAIQGSNTTSTGDCAVTADVTPLLPSDVVRGRDLFCNDTAFMNLTTDHRL
jgi:hypothetical protein